MKKIGTLIVLLLCCTTYLSAQISEDYEILFTDENGRQDVMELPESMMLSELDSMLALYHAKTYLINDEACESTGENPYYADDVYADRLSRMPTAIDMPYNTIVRQFIDRYCTRLRRSVSVMLGTSNFYMPIFEEALEAYNVPLELKYLPVIESALNPKAVSRVGATGLWQFMLSTGKQYGLRVNSLVDDRRDPIRASYAAARLLRDLFRIFGDWTLAIAAYNCGPANVNKAIRRSGGLRDFWKIYPYLPSETRGYVPAFIAANYVMTYYCEHNICPMLTNLPERTDTIIVDRNISLNTISKFCDINIDLLRELNPQYRRDLVNGSTEPSTIRMTIPSMNKFLELQDTIFAYDAAHVGGKRQYTAVEDKSTRESTSQRRSGGESNSSAYRSSRRSSSSVANTTASTGTSRYGRSQRGNSYSQRSGNSYSQRSSSYSQRGNTASSGYSSGKRRSSRRG